MEPLRVGMVAALTRAVEARDPYARGHSARVTALAEAVATRLGWGEAALAGLRLGARLHDVGKLAVDERVLLKPGRLSPAEFAQIRAHPAAGARLIERTTSFADALPYLLYHHERWDGLGYPTGRAGEEIPLGARILAVADAFDAMTSNRPYRRARPVGHALAELFRCGGSQFDPDVVDAFLDAWEHGALETASLPAAAAGSY